MSGETILVVDDEPDIRAIVKDILEDENYRVLTAENAQSARQIQTTQNIDLVLLDIWMPDTDGITLLREWMTDIPELTVVMISGHGTVETAVDAIRIGAYDFLEKPLSTAKLLVTVDRALESNRLQRENRELRKRIDTPSELIGSSEAINQLREHIERIGATDSWVMISGEAGCGKDLTARLLHQASTRRDKPFIDVSLAAIPSADVPMQLFGSESNNTINTGRFEQAAGGTLLLDEIADLDMATQTKLANALEQGQFARAGSTQILDLDVRILSATNQNIEQAVQQGQFREDLYYRLNVVPLRIPPLREHRDDIPALIEYYIDQVAQRDGLARREISEGALAALSGYDWPGNVRELKNVVQRILIFNQGEAISATEIREALHVRIPAMESLDQADFNAPLREAREQFEHSYFTYHLERLNGNVSELASVVGMERTNLYRKLKGLGIDPKARK